MSENSLPRDVLRWLQSLDLSYSIRNVKRDFSNGFLIAEILSRYYPSQVNVHGFSNGIGLTSKQDNWFQLEKLFRKFSIECTSETVNEIVHCKSGAAREFVESLYTVLTQKKISKFATQKRDLRIPPFARATASQAIKARLKEPDMLLVKDSKMLENSLRSVLDSHNSKTMEERSKWRSAVSEASMSLSSSELSREESKLQDQHGFHVMRSDIPLGGVEVKKVQVKQLGKSIPHVKGGKKITGVAAFGNSAMTSFSPKSTGSKNAGVSIIQIMNRCASPCVDHLEPTEPFSCFVTLLEENAVTQPRQDAAGFLASVFVSNEDQQKAIEEYHAGMKEDDALLVLEELGRELETLESPIFVEEVWTASNWLLTILECTKEDSDVFEVCRDVFCKFGQMLLRQVEVNHVFADKRAVLELVRDCMMDRLCTLIVHSFEKRRSLLMVLCNFAEYDPESRLDLIKLLHDSLNDITPFLHCLTILIFMEQQLSLVSPGIELLDLYAYYALMGISHVSPELRASSLAMLAVIVQHDPDSLERFLPQMESLVSDPWWEIQFQLIIVGSKFLDELTAEEQQETALFERCIDLVLRVFHPQSPVPVQKVGLSYLCQHVSKHPALLGTYMEILLGLSRKAFRTGKDTALYELFRVDKLLGLIPECEQLPVQSASGGVYHLPQLHEMWSFEDISSEFTRVLEQEQLENMEYWHFETLLGLVLSGCDVLEEGSVEEKSDLEGKHNGSKYSNSNTAQMELFHSLKNLVFIGMCDPISSELALQVIKVWILEYNFPVFQEKAFFAAFKLLFQSPQLETLHAKTGALMEAFLQGGDSTLRTECAKVITKLCSDHPELLENHILVRLESQV